MIDNKYVLFYRWIVINLACAVMLVLSYVNGWVELVLTSDQTHMVLVIAVVFAWGLVLSGWKTWKTSIELNHAREDITKSKWHPLVVRMVEREVSSRQVIEALRIKMFARISIIRWIANTLVLLGLIGTVVGFIIALSGVDPSASGNFQNTVSMIQILISGLSTALFTTLVGAVFNLWISANYHILSEGTSNLLASILEIEAIPNE